MLGTPRLFNFADMITPLLWLLAALVAVALLTWAIWYVFSPNGPRHMRRHIEFSTELRNDHGFVGVDMTPSRLVGAEGFALTDMRPAGKIVIDGQKPLDAVAVMDFINAGCRVKVTRYENAQLYVEQL